MNSMRRIIGLILLMALTSIPLWAGVTGKIAGMVTDKATRDPLPGATVMVVGTGLGAVTDLNGQYTILSVPPGFYDVQVSFIGYSKITMTDVKVNIDQTARLNFNLDMEVIQGEAVSVVAQKTVIKEDVATSVVSVPEREVQQLPVSTVDNVVGLQAGIQGLNIRGGMAEESLFLLDGAAQRDPRNNQPISRVAMSAVKEISIERGGFNAEYGQVQSGIINVVTKEGDKRGYFGTVTARVTPPAPKYYRENGIPDVHDLNSYYMRPYMDPEVCWTGTNNGAWDVYTRRHYPSFQGWNAVSEQLLTDNDPTNDLTPMGAQRAFMYETRRKQPNNLADYNIDAGFGGPIPILSKPLGGLRFFASYRKQRDVLVWPLSRPDYQDYDWTVQLNSDITQNMKLRFLTRGGNIATHEWNWAAGYYPHFPNEVVGILGNGILMWSDWGLSLTDIGHKAWDMKLTHTLNTKTFYEVSMEYMARNYFSRPPQLRDFSQTFQIIPGYYEDSNPYGYAPAFTGGIYIGRGEQSALARDYSRSKRLTLKADLTSQLNFNNLIKAGLEFQYNDLNLNYGVIQMQTEGKSWGSHVVMHNFPIQGSFYVQDKLETKSFTMNAGIRLDYNDSRVDWWNTNPYDPYFISSKYSPTRLYSMEKSKGQWSLSPRLGISHPISEKTKLFFNYGHFKEMPQYETLFRYDRNMAGELTRIGDPNLILAKTISYELGFDRILMNDFLLQLAAFYRDVSDQQNQTTYTPISGRNYTLTTSNTYRDVRGFELTLRKTAGRWFSGFMNYTYQVTSNGNFGQGNLYQDPSLQKKYDENTVNQYQQRPMPTPYARANLNFYTPGDFGPKVLGHSVLGDVMLNVILNWSKGGWTTYNPKGAPGISNNAQYVDYYDGTLRASKTFTIKRFKVQFLVDVNNLFNALRLWNNADQNYLISLHLPKSKAYDNIPGEDKIGDYRKPGVAWQPMEYYSVVDRSKAPVSDRPIFFEGTTGKFWQHTDGAWSEIPQSRIDQVNKDKAYIEMPEPSTFWFLSPRSVMFGARISFDLN